MIKINSYFGLFSIVLFALWGVIFFENLIAMEEIWRRSDTFAHGYFVLPIVIWLFWRDKAYFLNSKTQTSWFALPFIAGSLFVNLFAYAADINVLGQLSAVTCLISLIWLVLGNKLTWHYKFPLAYLIFLVPMGENLIPDLQDITAWFTVAFLKLHGIPVFRDGLYIQIPNGLFEVAVACSGIRYLIASLAVGTLFAYLSYNSFKKQCLFFLFALFLPILANGLRAYLIVIIAHYSDMEYATGADHLVYGWFFFGFIIMLMFWIGGKFADPEITNEEAKAKAIKEQKVASFSLITAITSVLFFVTTYTIKLSVPVTTQSDVAKAAIQGISQPANSNWGITFKDALAQSHVITPEGIEVFRAVYANKQENGELISHDNRIYEYDDWTIVDRVAFEHNGHKARYLLLRSISGKERVVLYWYRVGDKVLLDNKIVKIYQAINLFLNPLQTSEFVAFSATGSEQNVLLKRIKKHVQEYEQHFMPIVIEP